MWGSFGDRVGCGAGDHGWVEQIWRPGWRTKIHPNRNDLCNRHHWNCLLGLGPLLCCSGGPSPAERQVTADISQLISFNLLFLLGSDKASAEVWSSGTLLGRIRKSLRSAPSSQPSEQVCSLSPELPDCSSPLPRTKLFLSWSQWQFYPRVTNPPEPFLWLCQFVNSLSSLGTLMLWHRC